MSTRPPHEPSHCGCGHIATERNHYFTGKLMTARDFADEQTYFLSRHHLHNRLLHGWGILCGLRVRYHPDCEQGRDTECARRWVVIEPGIAIDCCGRELVLCERKAFDLKLQPKPNPSAPPDPSAPAYDAEPFLICVRYVEEAIECVPALYAEGECDPTRREPNRVREVAELVIRRLDEVPLNCWRMSGEPNGPPKAPCPEDCDQPSPGPMGSCLEPNCPCGDVVPLALIIPDPADGGEKAPPKEGEEAKCEHECGFRIDDRGRHMLPPPRSFQTHVVRVNWPHGGEVTLSHLREEMGGRLTIEFDRAVEPSCGDGTGVNAYTFLAEYGGAQRDVEFVPIESDPQIDADGRRAIYSIAKGMLLGRDTLANNVVFVTLKCDFIIDCHGLPVDGNHLAGRLPSGDGTPGGTFESWFRVVADPQPYGQKQEVK